MKKEREQLENDLKSVNFDMTSKFLTALAQDGAINEEAISESELDRIYGSYKEKVQESLKQQEELLKNIQVCDSCLPLFSTKEQGFLYPLCSFSVVACSIHLSSSDLLNIQGCSLPGEHKNENLEQTLPEPQCVNSHGPFLGPVLLCPCKKLNWCVRKFWGLC